MVNANSILCVKFKQGHGKMLCESHLCLLCNVPLSTSNHKFDICMGTGVNFFSTVLESLMMAVILTN